MPNPKQWVNFAKLRNQLSFARVLEFYHVSLAPKGDGGQYVGSCPLPKHGEKKGPTFSANLPRGVFQCFGCNQSGNVLDFAVLMEGFSKNDGKGLRKTALKLENHFSGKPPKEHRRDSDEPKPRRSKPPGSTVVNAPLDFALKTLEPDNIYFAEHKLNAETVARFGLGFCKRGTLAGRIAIPLHDDQGTLIGYSGLVTDQGPTPAGSPKYLFPESREHDGVFHVFNRSRFLYNGFRVGKAVKDLILVLECHSVWALWQGGFSNVVSLMGNDCSDDQAELIGLLTAPTARVWLLTDKSDASEACASSSLLKLARNRLCRWIRFEKQEDIAPEHPLLEVLPKR